MPDTSQPSGSGEADADTQRPIDPGRPPLQPLAPPVQESEISLAQAEGQLQIDRIDAENRQFLIRQMSSIFTLGNVLMWVAVGIFTVIDCLNFWVFKPTGVDRIVTSEVVYSLVGATVVQLGVIMVAISRNMFPSGTDTGS